MSNTNIPLTDFFPERLVRFVKELREALVVGAAEALQAEQAIGV
jgi:hypothetical protein